MRKLEERFGPGMDFLRQWESSGVPMQSTLLAFERRMAGDTIGAALRLDASAIVLFIKRVRAAVGAPVAIDYRYIPNDLVADWDETSAADRRSTSFGKDWSCVRVTSRLKQVSPAREEIEYLHLGANAPVLIRNLRYRDVNGRHVMAATRSTAAISFAIRLKSPGPRKCLRRKRLSGRSRRLTGRITRA